MKENIMSNALAIAKQLVYWDCECHGITKGFAYIDGNRLYVEFGYLCNSSTFMGEFMALAKATKGIFVVDEIKDDYTRFYILY